jgi:protoheme IX farnesyltransferase
LSGLALTIASACICNNYLDRRIDQNMERTASRGLASGAIPIQNALLLAAVLGTVGLCMLIWYVNLLVAALGIFAFIAYVIVYGAAKRRSVHGTVIGSISGALPPVAGYCAVSGHIDLAAVLLFLIVTAWQMPHFYAIALYRMSDYKAASIPVLPLVKGTRTTQLHILYYIGLYIVAVAGLYLFGYASLVYLLINVGLGLAWLMIGIRGLQIRSSAQIVAWGRQTFGFSLLVITGFCGSLILDAYIR